MPLLDSVPQLNSTCSLKSSNFRSPMSSGPLPGVMRFPFSTFQAGDAPAKDSFHPARSFPLKSGTGAAQVGAELRFSEGARLPVHCQVLPSGPFRVPERVFPVSLPSNTRSLLLSSSSFGDTNLSRPPEISTLGSGRALPQRPTISALSWPFSSRNSSQEGYSRLGAFRVKSQRPRNALAEPVEEFVGAFWFRECAAPANRITAERVIATLRNLMERNIPPSQNPRSDCKPLALSLILFKILFRDVVLRNFVSPYFAFIGIGNVFNSLDNFRLERVAFLEKFIHALRVRPADVRQTLQIAGLASRARAETLGFEHHGAYFFVFAANALLLFRRSGLCGPGFGDFPF